MIKGMTGFGQAEGNTPSGGKLRLEIRTSNHRFFETAFHLSEGLSFLEERIKKLLQKRIKRGRVTVHLSLEQKSIEKINVSGDLARSYYKRLQGLKRSLGLKDKITIEMIIGLPGVLNLYADQGEKEKIWLYLNNLVFKALDALLEMRRHEGEALYKDITQRIKLIRQSLNAIKQRFSVVIKKKKGSILNSEELSTFLKDVDITEEMVRLEIFLKNFLSLIKKGDPCGKELDFIAQELQREANTISAKALDGLTSLSVVRMKSEIEKIREQLQNVE